MNSTIQVLRQIPELRAALNEYNESFGAASAEKRLAAGLRELYSGLDKAATDYPPLIFWQVRKLLQLCLPRLKSTLYRCSECSDHNLTSRITVGSHSKMLKSAGTALCSP